MCDYVVIDLEMCNVSKKRRPEHYSWKQEIIQIGAVLLDEAYQPMGRFKTYVCPEYGIIEGDIKKLTGISNQMVQDAPNLKRALEMFFEWLPDEEVTFVAWSGNDERQIREEVKGKGIEVSHYQERMEHWVDFQREFSQRFDLNRDIKLENALDAGNIVITGRLHDAMEDALHTAKLYTKMKTQKDFQINPAYLGWFRDEASHLGFSLGDLFQSLNLDGCLCS